MNPRRRRFQRRRRRSLAHARKMIARYLLDFGVAPFSAEQVAKQLRGGGS